MSVLLSNIGKPINFAMNPFAFVGNIIANPAGGYTFVLESLADSNEYLHNIDASGRIGSPINVRLESGFASIDQIIPRNDGRFDLALYESSFSGNGKISLASLADDGTLQVFYTADVLSGNDSSFRVAFNDSGGLALARIGGTATNPARIVDIFDDNHEKIASVVIDKFVTRDQRGSTEVLALANGNFLVTWVEGDASGADLRAQVINSAGKLIGSNFTIGHADDLSTPANVVIYYEILATANGGFAVAYRSIENFPSSPWPEIDSGPTKVASWSMGTSGRYVQAADLIQDSSLSSPRIDSLIGLTDGRILEVVLETQTGSDGVLLKTLHGYLYDQTGGAAKDHFEFYTQASTQNYFEEDFRVEAGPDGSFVLIKTQFELGSSYSTQDLIQVYGLGEETYVTVSGATSGDDTLRGSGVRSDLINGSSGNDTLFGLGASDKLLGGYGHDRLDGGAGIDRMEGGSGNDTYVVDTLGDKVVEGRSAGLDTVEASVSYTLTDNVENLTLTGSAALRGFGNGQNNTITGNAGKNVLFGLGGADLLDGGRGADTLYGGSGADRFVFKAIGESGASATARDTIADFSRTARDKIDLTLIDANTNVAGNQDFSFIGTSAFTKTAGELRYSDTAAGTLLSGDVTGDGKADFSVLLIGKIALAQSDFL